MKNPNRWIARSSVTSEASHFYIHSLRHDVVRMVNNKWEICFGRSNGTIFDIKYPTPEKAMSVANSLATQPKPKLNKSTQKKSRTKTKTRKRIA